MIRYLCLLACTSVALAQRGSTGCLLQPVMGDARRFQVDAPLSGNRQFKCPTNTLFDEKACGCGWIDNPINPSPEIMNLGGRPSVVDQGFTMVNGQGLGQGLGQGQGGSGPMLTAPVSTTKPPCTLRPSIDRHKYEEFILGFDWMERRCPKGTLYNAAACACHDVDPNQIYTCHPELWINFNGQEIEDSAGYQISIGNNGNVVNVSNAGRFDGTGTLTVWQYANQGLGTELTVSLRFYEFPGGVSDEQVLVSNCFGRQLGSVEIVLNQQTKEVVFRLEAKLGKFSEGVEIRIPYREKAWKNVTMSYDGNYVTGQVDEEIKTASLKGDITTRYHGLLIGSCNGRGYVGYIDDLRLYRCLLDQRMSRFGINLPA